MLQNAKRKSSADILLSIINANFVYQWLFASSKSHFWQSAVGARKNYLVLYIYVLILSAQTGSINYFQQ